MERSTLKADALLLLAAAIWGSGFVAQRLGMEHVGPYAFTGIRFAIGVVVLLPFVYVRSRKPRSETPSERAVRVRAYMLGGLLAGSVLSVGAILQQIGLIYTPAGKAGFITGLYVIFVPMLGLLIGRRTSRMTWIGAALAVVGLYFLSVQESFQIGRGDWFVLAGAFVWAIHVLIIGWLSPKTDALVLATMQFSVCCVVGTIAALLLEETTIASLMAAKWAILYSGVFAIGAAFTLQIIAQRDAPPAHAAILLAFEAVFAVLFGWLILSERLGSREFFGCLLMLTGIIVSQLRRREKSTQAPS